MTKHEVSDKSLLCSVSHTGPTFVDHVPFYCLSFY